MKNRGITLIALAITIIILLILVGVTITILTGEDGVLNKANIAKEGNQEKIDYSFRLASVNGVEVAEANSELEEIKTLNQRISNLETAVQLLQKNKKPILIERNWGEAKNALDPNNWNRLEEVPLAEYGTGKAIISYSLSNTNTKAEWLSIQIIQQGIKGTDQINAPLSVDWLRASTTASISYDENTKIIFEAISNVNFIPYYTYSILLIPDEK